MEADLCTHELNDYDNKIIDCIDSVSQYGLHTIYDEMNLSRYINYYCVYSFRERTESSGLHFLQKVVTSESTLWLCRATATSQMTTQ